MDSNIGARRDIQEVFKSAPFDKQVMMFTATLPTQVKSVCLKFMKTVLMKEEYDHLAFVC